jgi:hypothetical protein
MIVIKNKILYWLIGFVTFVLMINYLPFMRIFIGEYWYYSNYDGSFKDEEIISKGRTLKSVKERFDGFLERHPEKRIDTTLYINDKKNYLKFWNYRDYGDHPRWDLPYKSLDSLKTEISN